MNENDVLRDALRAGYKSLGEAWDAYCEENENYLGIGSDPIRNITDKFANWIGNQAAAYCTDCTDDRSFDDEEGGW